MKYEVSLFEVTADRKSADFVEKFSIEATTIGQARELARDAVIKKGYAIRALSHAADGGLIAYVIKDKPEVTRRHIRPRRKKRAVR